MIWTLLLRLEGPMQSWGLQSRFEVRDTGTEPSKSGVIGLVCAALGRDRSEPIDDLTALRMGVRVDREGEMRRDYQTAVRWKRDRRGEYSEGSTTLSDRYYLADASFLVGLEGEDHALLNSIADALDHPHWPLALGRKAFPPSVPIRVRDGLVKMELEEALVSVPLGKSLDSESARATDGSLRLVIERSGDTPDGLVVHRRPDQPVTFLPRRFTTRDVVVSFIPRSTLVTEAADVPV